jgi:hypothetical protein
MVAAFFMFGLDPRSFSAAGLRVNLADLAIVVVHDAEGSVDFGFSPTPFDRHTAAQKKRPELFQFEAFSLDDRAEFDERCGDASAAAIPDVCNLRHPPASRRRTSRKRPYFRPFVLT